MLQAFHKLSEKLKTIPELKSALQQLWDDVPQTFAIVWMHVLRPVVDFLNIRYQLF